MLGSDLDHLIYKVLLSRINKKKKMNNLICRNSIIDLIKFSKKIIIPEPTMIRLDNPITIVGDIHGNIDDLIRIFERCGYPPDTSYLFLGDYIDRGQFSIEVMVLLLSLKCKYPKNINLLRGNHETKSISKEHGFYDECCRKYDHFLYESFFDLFGYFPIAALVADIVFCVHGGISPKLKNLEDFVQLQKPYNISNESIFTDLLWSDPFDDIKTGFMKSPRGIGYYFSSESLNSFLKRNNIQFIIRSHEECFDGYKWSFDDRTCLTIFSNSNYCCHYNDAMVVSITKDLKLTNERFSPLSETKTQKRRIIFPDWLFKGIENYQLSIPISSNDEITPYLIDDPIHCV